jgi:hypothetical protein
VVVTPWRGETEIEKEKKKEKEVIGGTLTLKVSFYRSVTHVSEVMSSGEESAVVFQHQNDVFKRLVVCGHYHRKVAEELRASQIIETREKRWTSTLNEREYVDLVEQAVVSFDKACVQSDILVQYVAFGRFPDLKAAPC